VTDVELPLDVSNYVRHGITYGYAEMTGSLDRHKTLLEEELIRSHQRNQYGLMTLKVEIRQ